MAGYNPLAGILLTLEHADVGMAKSGSADAEKHFSRPRLGLRHFDDF
jgi:hypothetical protein